MRSEFAEEPHANQVILRDLRTCVLSAHATSPASGTSSRADSFGARTRSSLVLCPGLYLLRTFCVWSLEWLTFTSVSTFHLTTVSKPIVTCSILGLIPAPGTF